MIGYIYFQHKLEQMLGLSIKKSNNFREGRRQEKTRFAVIMTRHDKIWKVQERNFLKYVLNNPNHAS